MKLYSGPLSMYGMKAEIALREKRLPFELELVPFDRVALYQPKHPEVLRINPKRQVPVLVDGALEIYDSTQIFEYLEHRWPELPLWPADPFARALARRTELESDEVFFPHVIRLMGLEGASRHPDAREHCDAIGRFYASMDERLALHEWLAGDYGYADIAFFMAQLFAARMAAPMTEGTPRLVAWRARVAARPAVRTVLDALVAYLERTGLAVPEFARRAA